MRRFVALVLAVLAGAGIVAARADSYPSRPITIVVPYPAGGPTDTIARLLAQRMQKPLGQPVVVTNISGGGGSIGVGRVAHSPPDGYMLSIGHTQTAVFNPVILKLDYDPLKDLAPVSLIADTPIWIVANKALPPSDVKSLIVWLKAQGGKATMATVGVGGPTDIAARVFEKVTGTAFQIVPYRGGAPVAEDLMGGHVDFAFGQAAGTLPFVQSGQLKAYRGIAAEALVGGAECADARRTRHHQRRCELLARHLGAGRHATGRDRETQCRHPRELGRSCGAGAIEESRSGGLAARRPDARGASRKAESRNDQMDAGHQGGGHQGGVIRFAAGGRI